MPVSMACISISDLPKQRFEEKTSKKSPKKKKKRTPTIIRCGLQKKFALSYENALLQSALVKKRVTPTLDLGISLKKYGG